MKTYFVTEWQVSELFLQSNQRRNFLVAGWIIIIISQVWSIWNTRLRPNFKVHSAIISTQTISLLFNPDFCASKLGGPSLTIIAITTQFSSFNLLSQKDFLLTFVWYLDRSLFVQIGYQNKQKYIYLLAGKHLAKRRFYKNVTIILQKCYKFD